MAKTKSFGKGGRIGEGSEPQPLLPAWKAFVVQFTRETGVEANTFAGRVEHLATGQKTLFESLPALARFVDAVLQQPHSTSHAPAEITKRQKDPRMGKRAGVSNRGEQGRNT